MSKFEEFYNKTFTLEDRITNPALRADTLLIWNACRDEMLKIVGKSCGIRYAPYQIELIKSLEKL